MKKMLSLLAVLLLALCLIPCAMATTPPDTCPHTHTADPVYVTLEDPTCTTEGKKKEVIWCLDCDKMASSREIPIDKLPHDYTNTTVPPTCISDGYVLKVCKMCDDTRRDPGATALGHDFSVYLSVAEPATATQNAKALYQCSRCTEQTLKELPGTKRDPSPSTPPEPTMYTLTLIPDPATMGTVEGAGQYPYSTSANAIAKPFEGYTFTGWTDQNGNSVGSSSDRVLNVVMNSDLTYTAHFKAGSSPVTPPPSASYNVTPATDPVGIAVISGIGPHTVGTYVTLTAGPSIERGYTFSHWVLTGMTNYNSLSNPCLFVMPENDVSATAVYTKSQTEYRITYTPDQYSKETASVTQTKYSDVSAVLKTSLFTSARDGYVQTGWQTATGVKYAFGAAYTADANLDLYPVWGVPGQHTLTVKFNDNGKGKVHTGNDIVTSGTTYPLKDDSSATFTFDTVEDIYPYNVILNGVSKGHMDKIVVSGQAYDQILEIDFESVYTNPKTGDDAHVLFWVLLGAGALLCGAAVCLPVRKKLKG